jgi:hypothetical protein
MGAFGVEPRIEMAADSKAHIVFDNMMVIIRRFDSAIHLSALLARPASLRRLDLIA